jgi:phosphoribosylglycinamide formyltransferase-1
MTRFGVLISGKGSNLRAVLEAKLENVEVACVISNVPGVLGLEVARQHGVPMHVVRHQDYGSREAFDDTIVKLLDASKVDFVLLAGFMRLLTKTFLERYALRTINVHPSLLPAFPGAHAVKDALGYGVKVTGATVHFVDEGTDTGPIILQKAVDVLPDDDEAALHARIQRIEHEIVPQAVALVASGGARLDGRRVVLSNDGGARG